MTRSAVNATVAPTSVEDLLVERDALRAERDALRRQLASGARPPGRQRRPRSIVAVALVVCFGLLFLAAGVGLWLHRSTLNQAVWEERVVPVGQDAAVQDALARWTTDQIMEVVQSEALVEAVLPERGAVLVPPITAAVRGFVEDRVDTFFASERFASLWAVAATQAHEAAVAVLRDERSNVEVSDDRVTIDLLPIIDPVLADVLDAAPELVGVDVDLPEVSVSDLPAGAQQRLSEALGRDLDDDFGTVVVYDGGRLSTAQDVVAAFDRLVILAIVLGVLTAVAAVWVSPARRRTILQLLGAAALACVVIRRATFALQDEVLGIVRVDDNRDAVAVVVGAFAEPLTDVAATALWVIAGLALATAVTGPYRWAVALRASVVGAVRALFGPAGQADPTASWIADHADGLRLGGAVAGALALWLLDVGWWGLVVVAVLVVAWSVLVARIRDARVVAPPPRWARSPGTTPSG